MDPDQVKKASMQIGFIRFVLIPLFEALSKVLMITYADRKIFFFFQLSNRYGNLNLRSFISMNSNNLFSRFRLK